MNKGRSGVRVVTVTRSPERIAWVLLPAAFLLGGLTGHLIAGTQHIHLAQVLSEYGTGSLVSVFDRETALKLLWRLLRMLALTCVLSFSALGVIGLPAFMSAQGFLTGFAISALVRTWGYSGLAAAALWVGLGNLFPLTVLLLVGVPGWVLAYSIATGERRGVAVTPDEVLRCAGACLVGLAAAVCSQWLICQYLTPAMLAGFSGT